MTNPKDILTEYNIMSLVPPTSKDGFYFAVDSLYVEASGHNRHRRATITELNSLFHPDNAANAPKDPVGHWYEAQLRHYGLPPSKKKAVAKSRLLDAVNKGNLVVPAHIQKLESEMKKEWIKKEREAKMELKEKKKNDEPAPRGKKRKDETDTASSLTQTPKPDSSNSATNTHGTSDTNPPKPKRLKQTAKRGSSSTSPKKGKTVFSSNVPKQTAKREGAARGIKNEAETPEAERPR